ncbi:MAG: hypothetical protein HQL80_12535, partial [Magnetococcales bacterium]|nr:hypothetical protein [Magnetococcales bacterium]
FGDAVHIARGGNIFDQIAPKENKIAYLAIDMNDADLEIMALSYCWPKLSAGAIVVLDDYGCPGHLEQKIAFDRFAQSNNVDIVSLPTGQGMLIKC